VLLCLPAVIEMKGIQLRGAPLYLDMQATTPMDPRVLDAMLPYMVDQVGSPSSTQQQQHQQ
jgi:cysteine desulfurase